MGFRCLDRFLASFGMTACEGIEKHTHSICRFPASSGMTACERIEKHTHSICRFLASPGMTACEGLKRGLAGNVIHVLATHCIPPAFFSCQTMVSFRVKRSATRNLFNVKILNDPGTCAYPARFSITLLPLPLPLPTILHFRGHTPSLKSPAMRAGFLTPAGRGNRSSARPRAVRAPCPS